MMMSGWGPYFLVIGFRFDTAALAEKKQVETRFRIHHEQIALPRAEVDLPRLFISTK